MSTMFLVTIDAQFFDSYNPLIVSSKEAHRVRLALLLKALKTRIASGLDANGLSITLTKTECILRSKNPQGKPGLFLSFHMKGVEMVDKLNVEAASFLKAIHPAPEAYPIQMDILGDHLKRLLMNIGCQGSGEDIRMDVHPRGGLMLQQQRKILASLIASPHDFMTFKCTKPSSVIISNGDLAVMIGLTAADLLQISIFMENDRVPVLMTATISSNIKVSAIVTSLPVTDPLGEDHETAFTSQKTTMEISHQNVVTFSDDDDDDDFAIAGTDLEDNTDFLSTIPATPHELLY